MNESIKSSLSIIPLEQIANKIYLVRGTKVMLDRDLAELYGVETKYLKRQVRRNIERFPEDFAFQLEKEELKNWRSQFGTSNSSDKMGLRYPPFAFTEQGVAMLSGVLKSKRAVQVNMQIIRTFTKLRAILASDKAMRLKVEQMDKQIQSIYKLLGKMLVEEEKPKNPMGFGTG